MGWAAAAAAATLLAAALVRLTAELVRKLRAMEPYSWDGLLLIPGAGIGVASSVGWSAVAAFLWLVALGVIVPAR